MNIFRRTTLALALAALSSTALADSASERALAERVDKLARELSALQAELAAMKAAPAPAPVAAAAPVVLPVSETEPATVLGSYGEINLNVPTGNGRSGDTQIDVRRFVLGFQHRFDAKTKLVTELEVEHAVSSADDAGEVEVEQAYVEREINGSIAARAGLMLIPIGLLNENHEPTSYYGVERNFVETAIIPSTLREAGVQGVFTFGNGYTLQGGVVTGPDISKFETGEGVESPLGAVHQEGQLAKARDPSFFGALNWRGLPGLQLGAAAIGGNATHGTEGFPTAGYLLWDVHARYSPGPFQLSALYTQGSFTNTGEINASNPVLIPKRFDGLLFEAGYKLWKQGDLRLEPFARWEQVNTGRKYEITGAPSPDQLPTERITTVGASFFLGEGVVLKADYQFFQQADNADRLNLGMGWHF